jgi:hypothetical protein
MSRRNAVGFIIESAGPASVACAITFARQHRWPEVCLSAAVVIVSYTIDRIAVRLGIGVSE